MVSETLVSELDAVTNMSEAGGFGRGAGYDRFHVGSQVGEGGHEQWPAGGQPGGEDEVGQQEIEDRTGRDDGRALEERRVGERPLLVLLAHLVAEVLAQHLDVAAERDRGDDVFGLADLPAGQFRPEADGELQDLDPAASGDPEVAEFVEGDEGAEGDREGEGVKPVVLDGLHARRALLQTCSLVYHRDRRDYFTTAGADSEVTTSPAFARAQASVCSASSIVETSTGLCASMVRRMVSAMPRKPIRRSRKACTATSLAAFRAAGNVPPPRRAS